MYNRNIDATTLEFASSSYIPADGIELVEAYYQNYLDQRVNLSESDVYGIYDAITAKAQQGVLNGKITVTSPFVKMSRQEMDAAVAELVKPAMVPEPAGKPAEVENPDNDATLNSIASKHSSGWDRVGWRRNAGKVEFYASSWYGNAYIAAQDEYDALKEVYDNYLVELEEYLESNPEYAGYLKSAYP